MTEKQLREVYVNARSGAGKKDIDPSEFIAWRNVLGKLNELDVCNALNAWQRDTSLANDGTERRRGETMPKAVSLKAIIEGARRIIHNDGSFHACGNWFKTFPETFCCEGVLMSRRVDELGRYRVRSMKEFCECLNRFNRAKDASAA